MKVMSEDAKAIILLCGRLGDREVSQPLNQKEYNQVVQWLIGNNLRPADLLCERKIDDLAAGTGMPQARLSALMARGVKMGFAIESWERSGIWVICRSDPEYPNRYKTHLKEKAPPILFCAGEPSLLKGGGLAIVGSRNVDQAGEEFTSDVSAWCARKQVPVVSGGARGVDAIAMTSALDAGGAVIGVLADNLLKRSVSRESRYAIADGRLLLLSPYHPEAGFNVGNAMGRNKLVYAMAEYGLVISADYNKGGTWEGAKEELKRTPHRAVFVRISGRTPKGNHKLVELGALPFPAYSNEDDPVGLLAATKSSKRPSAAPGDELPLFDRPGTGKDTAMLKENVSPFGDIGPESTVADAAPARTAYDAVLPLLLEAAKKPTPPAELADRLDVTKTQLQAWLKRAVAEKKIIKKGRPVKYVKA